MKRWASTFAILTAAAMFLASLVIAARLVYDMLGGLIP